MLNSDYDNESNTLRVVLNYDLIADVVSCTRIELKKHLEQDVRKLVIDMRSCRSIDSHGVALLLAASNSMQSKKASIYLDNLSFELSEVFKVLGITEKFIITTQKLNN
ncbi:MAG: STAS domain-containing protein [Candidatus Riflebacteria bacterium]|nr:STAS domain-containing protein [Candidatus Riflebacteria bacterium]